MSTTSPLDGTPPACGSPPAWIYRACAQAASFDKLAETVAALAPELLTLNPADDLPATVPVHLTAHRTATVRVHA